MKELFRFVLLVCLLTQGNSSYSQEKDFKIYVFQDRYSNEGKNFIKQRSNFKEIKLLGGYMIDHSKKGVIDLLVVKKYLKILFPNSNSQGDLCINLENKYYQNLRNYNKSDKEFLEAETEFLKLINFIHFYRPQIKFGIYGLPFRTFYQSQKVWNSNDKLDEILSKVNYIFPSMYILYPDKEKGQKSNNSYLKKNLETAFNYGDRLGKPVIPFVWYMINPGNKKYGGEILNKSAMKRYLNYIKSYRTVSNHAVNGIVWWESSNSLFIKKARLPEKLERNNVVLDRNAILKKYTNLIN